MIQKELNNGLVQLTNGTSGIVDTRNGQRYTVAEVKKRDVKWFKDWTEE